MVHTCVLVYLYFTFDVINQGILLVRIYQSIYIHYEMSCHKIVSIMKVRLLWGFKVVQV